MTKTSLLQINPYRQVLWCSGRVAVSSTRRSKELPNTAILLLHSLQSFETCCFRGTSSDTENELLLPYTAWVFCRHFANYGQCTQRFHPCIPQYFTIVSLLFFFICKHAYMIAIPFFALEPHPCYIHQCTDKGMLMCLRPNQLSLFIFTSLFLFTVIILWIYIYIYI